MKSFIKFLEKQADELLKANTNKKGLVEGIIVKKILEIEIAKGYYQKFKRENRMKEILVKEKGELNDE